MYKKVESEKDINELVAIAYEIWSKHFGQLFDADTLSKLIEGVQSKTAILADFKNGYDYYFITESSKNVGYFAYKILSTEDELFLNKLYIFADQRGKGIGKKVLKYLEDICLSDGVNSISLTVFHENTNSVKAYEKWGFENLGLIKKVFSDDLVFDDFKMRKKID